MGLFGIMSCVSLEVDAVTETESNAVMEFTRDEDEDRRAAPGEEIFGLMFLCSKIDSLASVEASSVGAFDGLVIVALPGIPSLIAKTGGGGGRRVGLPVFNPLAVF